VRVGAGVKGLDNDDEDLPPPLQPLRFEKAAMNWLTLTFEDPEVELAFRKHVKTFIVPRVKVRPACCRVCLLLLVTAAGGAVQYS
jgi:hypothetical protein